MRRFGVQVDYVGLVTPSYLANLMLQPLELLVRRLVGARLVHLHWIYDFYLPGSSHWPVLSRIARARFAFWLRTVPLLGYQLVGGMTPRKAAVIPHGPFIAAVPPESLRTPGSGSGPRTLLFSGKIWPYKGVRELLAAFDRVQARLEHLPEAELSRLFAEADVVILPSRQITTSGSIVMALCHGRSVIIPDLPALAHLPVGAVNRYDGTVEGLTESLADMTVADASILEKMSDKAYAYCSSISWGEIGSVTVKSMKQLFDGET